MLTPADFRAVDVFEDQPEEHLAWLAGAAEERRFAAGERTAERGEAADHLQVLFEGAVQIFTFPRGARVLFGAVSAGEVTGVLPFSRMREYGGEGVAAEPVRAAYLHRRHFPELVARMPEVGERLVGRMTDRVRESSRLQQQQEKMLALGKLSAGLAHELNNPAAAVQRAVSDLRERFGHMVPLMSRLTGHGLTPDQVEAARAALKTCTAPTPGTVSAVDRAEREDEIADWLEGHGVPHAYVVAEVLAEEGVTTDALGHLAGHVPPDALADVVLWIEKGMASERLMGEIAEAAGRISELVRAVKGYTHRDQAPERQRVDVHAGLDRTLVMLGHAIKAKGVAVERDFAEVPPVCVFPGEIQQVWTNLLDNAFDAAPADGARVRLRTYPEGQTVCVAVEDNGPGVPPEIRDRIFEPFYTTKPTGQGTGLGLDIARRIVAQHSGTIRLESNPGRTVFTVCLPVDAPKEPVFVPTEGAAEPHPAT